MRRSSLSDEAKRPELPSLMAILIRGKSRCRLCGEVIVTDDAVVMFPPGLVAADHPASPANDSSFHAECLERQSWSAAALAALAEYQESVER